MERKIRRGIDLRNLKKRTIGRKNRIQKFKKGGRRKDKVKKN